MNEQKQSLTAFFSNPSGKGPSPRVGVHDSTTVGRVHVELCFSRDENAWLVTLMGVNADGTHNGFLPGDQHSIPGGKTAAMDATNLYGAIVGALIIAEQMRLKKHRGRPARDLPS